MEGPAFLRLCLDPALESHKQLGAQNATFSPSDSQSLTVSDTDDLQRVRAWRGLRPKWAHKALRCRGELIG